MDTNVYTWDYVVKLFKLNISEVVDLKEDQIIYSVTSPRFKNKKFVYKVSYSYAIHLQELGIDYKNGMKQLVIKKFDLDTILGSQIST
jgi:hypothetical protein